MFDRFYYKNIFVAKQNEIKTSKDKETTNKQKKKGHTYPRQRANLLVSKKNT